MSAVGSHSRSRARTVRPAEGVRRVPSKRASAATATHRPSNSQASGEDACNRRRDAHAKHGRARSVLVAVAIAHCGRRRLIKHSGWPGCLACRLREIRPNKCAEGCGRARVRIGIFFITVETRDVSVSMGTIAAANGLSPISSAQCRTACSDALK